MSTENDLDRYLAAAHAMQSGVAARMNFDPHETDLKHFRVGINSAMSDQGGLATLLIAKGVFTEEEYTAAVADAMEREKARYEKELSEHFGRPVKLG